MSQNRRNFIKSLAIAGLSMMDLSVLAEKMPCKKPPKHHELLK